jgi:exosome complex RNA-binding protein Csl4
MMDGSFVLPGDVVGSTEEFVPGDSTYAKGGMIFASSSVRAISWWVR